MAISKRPRTVGALTLWLFLWFTAVMLAFALLALASIVLVPLGVVLAVLVVRRPTGAGARVRAWRVWRFLPGMDARRGAAGFAAMLLLYLAAAPAAAVGLVFAGSRGSGGGNGQQATAAVSAPTAAATATTAPSARPTSTATPVPTATASATPTQAPTAAPTPAPTPVPTAAPTRVPTAVPTAAPAAPPPAAAASTCGAPANPWNYGFCSGSTISSPPSGFCSYFNCIANFPNGRGYVIECTDATYSKSGGIQGSCSQHGGNWRALLQP